MKNLVLIFSLIFLVSSCATIDEQYTGKRIRVKSEKHEEYYDESPYYSPYIPSYYYGPVYWGGFSWGFPYFFWSPYSYYGLYDYYYGFYNPYYGYYGRYYRGYPIYYRSRYGTPVITKKQLQKRTSSRLSTKNAQGSAGRIKSTGSRRATVTRARSSTRSRTTSSSRGGRGTVRKKR
jgi:hypothetical protein